MADARIDLAAQFNQTMFRPLDQKKEEPKPPEKTETAEGKESEGTAQKTETPVSTQPKEEAAPKPSATKQQDVEQPQTRRLGEEKEDFVPTTQQEDKTSEAARDMQGPLADMVRKQAFAPKDAKIYSSETAPQDGAKADEAQGGAPAQEGQQKLTRNQAQVSDFLMESWKEYSGEKQAPEMAFRDQEKEEQQNIRQEQWAMPGKGQNLETNLKSLMAHGTLQSMKMKGKEEKEGSDSGGKHIDDEKGETGGKRGAGGMGGARSGLRAGSGGNKRPASQTNTSTTSSFLAKEREKEGEKVRQQLSQKPAQDHARETNLKSLMAQETIQYMKPKTKEEKEGLTAANRALDEEEGKQDVLGKQGAGGATSSKSGGPKASDGKDKKPMSQAGSAGMPNFLTGDRGGGIQTSAPPDLSPKIVSVRNKKDGNVSGMGMGFSRQRNEGLYVPGSSFTTLTTPKSMMQAPGSAPWKQNDAFGTTDAGLTGGPSVKPQLAATDAPKVDAPKVDAPKVDAPKVDTPPVTGTQDGAPKVTAGTLQPEAPVSAPTTEQKTAAPVAGQKTDAPTTGQQTGAPTTEQKTDATTTGQQTGAPTTEQKTGTTTTGQPTEKPKEDPGAAAYRQSQWYTKLSEEQRKKVDSQLGDFSAEERQKFDKTMGSLKEKERAQALKWMEEADGKEPGKEKKPEEEKQDAITARKDIAKNLETLSKVNDPKVREQAFSMVDQADSKDRPKMIKDLYTTLGGKQDVQSQQTFMNRLSTLDKDQRKEILGITGELKHEDRQAFMDRFGKMSNEQLQDTLSYMKSSDYYKKLNDNAPYETANAKADALMLASTFERKDGKPPSAEEIKRRDELIKATQDGVKDTGTALDRKYITKLMTESDPKTAERTMQFFKDQKTLGKTPLTEVPQKKEGESDTDFYNRCKQKDETEDAFKTRMGGLEQTRKKEVLTEAYARLRVGNSNVDGHKPSEAASDRLVATLVDTARGNKGKLDNDHMLSSLRVLDRIEFADKDPNFNTKSRVLTLPKELLDTDKELGPKQQAMLLHEFTHVSFKASLSPELSGARDSMAVTSRVTSLYEDVMKTPESQQKFLDALGKRYKELGYSDREIEAVKREALKDPDEYMAHVATMTGAKDKDGKRGIELDYIKDSIPKEALKFQGDWVGGKLPTDDEMLGALNATKRAEIAKGFTDTASSYYQYLQDPANAGAKQTFMDAATKRFKELGYSDEDIKKRLDGMMAPGSTDKFTDGFAELCLKHPETKDSTDFLGLGLGTKQVGADGLDGEFGRSLPPGVASQLRQWDAKVHEDAKKKGVKSEDISYTMVTFTLNNKDKIAQSEKLLDDYKIDDLIKNNTKFQNFLDTLAYKTADADSKWNKAMNEGGIWGFFGFGGGDSMWDAFGASDEQMKAEKLLNGLSRQIIRENEKKWHELGAKYWHGYQQPGPQPGQYYDITQNTGLERAPVGVDRVGTTGIPSRTTVGPNWGVRPGTTGNVGNNTGTGGVDYGDKWGYRPSVGGTDAGSISGPVIGPTPKPYPEYPKPDYSYPKPDLTPKDPEEKLEFSDKTQSVIDRRKAEAEAKAEKQAELEQMQAEETRLLEEAQVQQQKAEANKTWEAMKPLLSNSSPDSAHQLAQLLLQKGASPDQAKEILKNFMSLMGKKDGPQQAASFLRTCSSTPAGTDGLMKFLTAASKDSEGSAMAAKLLESGSSHYDGASGLHQMMHSLSSQPDKAQEFARLLNQASNSRDGSASLAKTFQNLTKFPGGAENMAQFLRTASSTGAGGREMSQAFANMSSTRTGAQALANFFNTASSQSPASLNNLLSSFSQMSSTKEGARFLSHAMANTASFPETGKAMAQLVQGAAGTSEGTQALFSALKNMSSSSDGARNVAMFMQSGASTPQGADALSRALRSMTSSGQGIQDMASLFSKASATPQGSEALSHALLSMAGGRGNGEAVLGFFQKASATPRSAAELSNMLSQVSSSPKGAENLSQLMARLSTSKDGSKILMQCFSNVSTSPAGARSLGTAFMNLSNSPQGSAMLSQFLAKSSGTPDGQRMLLQTFSGMSSTSEGAHSVARFFEGTSMTRQGAEGLVSMMQNMSGSQQGVRDLTNLLLRGSQSEDGSMALSRALSNMSEARGGSETIGKFMLNASSNGDTALALGRAMAQMSSTDEGARSIAQFIARSPNTPEGQQMALKAFGNMAQSPEGAQNLAKMLAQVSKNGDGAQQLSAFLQNASSTPGGTTSLLNMMSRMMASPDGSRDFATFLARSSATPGGAQSIAGTFNNLSSSRESLQQFMQLIGNSSSSPAAGKAFAQTLANLASNPAGAESIGNLINSSLSSDSGTQALRQSLLSMTSTPEGALNISQFVANYSGNSDGSRILMDAFNKMASTPKGMADLGMLLERGTANPQGAKLLNQTLLNLSSSREGAEQLAGLLSKTSSSAEGAKALNRALVNIAYTGEGAASLGKVMQQMTSSSQGAQSMAQALRNLSSTREGAENVAIFLKNCSSSQEGMHSLQQSLLNLSSVPDGADSLAKFLGKASGSEFGGKALMEAFRGMTSTPEGSHNLSLLLQQTTSSPRGAMDFATFLRNTGGQAETGGEFARQLGEMSKNPDNVGALSRWIGNMNRTGEGREALLEYFMKSSGTTDGAKNLAKLFDQASTNSELKRQLDSLIQQSSTGKVGASRVETLMNNIDRGRREQVLSGTKGSDVAVAMRGEEAAPQLKEDVSMTMLQRPVLGRRGFNSDAEQKIMDARNLEAGIRKAEIQLRAGEKALNTSLLGEREAQIRESMGGASPTGGGDRTAKMAAAERDVARVAQMEDMREASEQRKSKDIKKAYAAPEESGETKDQKLPHFRPIDIYPESILRYLNICPQCGNKCNERDIFCMRCEVEYNRQTYMESAVKFTRAGYYFKTYEDKIDFTGTAKGLFDSGEVENEVAVLRRPPQYPKYQEFLALSH